MIQCSSGFTRVPRASRSTRDRARLGVYGVYKVYMVMFSIPKSSRNVARLAHYQDGIAGGFVRTVNRLAAQRLRLAGGLQSLDRTCELSGSKRECGGQGMAGDGRQVSTSIGRAPCGAESRLRSTEPTDHGICDLILRAPDQPQVYTREAERKGKRVSRQSKMIGTCLKRGLIACAETGPTSPCLHWIFIHLHFLVSRFW